MSAVLAAAPAAAASALTTLRLPRAAPARVLAFGAYLKNTACLVDGDTATLSPLHGDLDDPAACAALDASVDALLASCDRPIEAVAHDLHPDFHSTRLACAVAHRLGVPAIGVQHHHAHIAVVQAEAGLDEPVIGVAMDGVGLGSDATAWGGEWLLVHGARWRRLDHLPPIALPGGDVAAREPWRLASAALHALGRGDEIAPRFGPRVGASTASLLQQLLRRNLNCPPSTAAGRWFDAAAGALGLSVRQSAQAEAAMALERRAAAWLDAHPRREAELRAEWNAAQDARETRQPLDLLPLLGRLLDVGAAVRQRQMEAGGRAAAGFHLALAHGAARVASRLARVHDARTVVLAGGCFFNRILSSRLRTALEADGLRVLQPERVNCGDAGLALGQAWAAALALADERRRPDGADHRED